MRLLRDWKVERELWLTKHPLPWEPRVWGEYNERFPLRVESWLDRGMGKCLLKQPGVRRIVCDALHHFDGERYEIAGFVVMPNHVHIAFQVVEGGLIEGIMHSWKSYTAKEINKLTGSRGELWQRGYWDRLIRSQVHFDRCIRYMRENPAVGSIRASEYTLYTRTDFEN